LGAAINRVRTAAVIISAAVTGVLTAAVFVLLFTGLPASTQAEDYLLAFKNEAFPSAYAEMKGFEDETQHGDYTVKTLDYGAAENTASEAVLKAGRVNLGPYVGGYKGIQKLYRRLYQGYDIYSVPLRAGYGTRGKI
jgi:hypothetical protein